MEVINSTSSSGTRNETIRAGTAGPLISNTANSVWTTRVGRTGALASVSDTLFASRAILVRVTSENAHIIQADMTQKAIVVHAASHCNAMYM